MRKNCLCPVNNNLLKLHQFKIVSTTRLRTTRFKNRNLLQISYKLNKKLAFLFIYRFLFILKFWETHSRYLKQENIFHPHMIYDFCFSIYNNSKLFRFDSTLILDILDRINLFEKDPSNNENWTEIATDGFVPHIRIKIQ